MDAFFTTSKMSLFSSTSDFSIDTVSTTDGQGTTEVFETTTLDLSFWTILVLGGLSDTA